MNPIQEGQEWLDQQMMRQALREAERAQEADDVPVGAVIVRQGRVIGRGYNQREQLQDPTAHAEMIALTAAAADVRSWRLEDCTLYVTLEPCTMCAGAIVLARIQRVVFGADDPKAGACGSVYNIIEDGRLNHRPQMTGGILATECGDLLRAFFAAQRAKGKK
jgi:tRNA(adenine34) deaminase